MKSKNGRKETNGHAARKKDGSSTRASFSLVTTLSNPVIDANKPKTKLKMKPWLAPISLPTIMPAEIDPTTKTIIQPTARFLRTIFSLLGRVVPEVRFVSSKSTIVKSVEVTQAVILVLVKIMGVDPATKSQR